MNVDYQSSCLVPLSICKCRPLGRVLNSKPFHLSVWPAQAWVCVEVFLRDTHIPYPCFISDLPWQRGPTDRNKARCQGGLHLDLFRRTEVIPGVCWTRRQRWQSEEWEAWARGHKSFQKLGRKSRKQGNRFCPTAPGRSACRLVLWLPESPANKCVLF